MKGGIKLVKMCVGEVALERRLLYYIEEIMVYKLCYVTELIPLLRD